MSSASTSLDRRVRAILRPARPRAGDVPVEAAGLGGSFFLLSGLIGVVYANMAVGIPLMVEREGRSVSIVGAVLAGGTVMVAVAALLSGSLGTRIGGPRRLLLLTSLISSTATALLVLSSSVLAMAGAAALVGASQGTFWVASQRMLARASGSRRSEQAFVRHYAAYRAGTMLGSFCTGALVWLTRSANSGSILIVFGLGLAASVAGILLWIPHAWRERETGRPTATTGRSLGRGTGLQLPAFFVVAGLAFIGPLAPVTLRRDFGASPLLVGVVMTGLAAAAVVGILGAGRFASAYGPRVALVGMLTVGSGLALVLALAAGLGSELLFIGTIFGTVMLLTGSWPVLVDAAQARTPSEERRALSVAWNVREYCVIAASIATGGGLLAISPPPVPFLCVAVFLAAAVGSALTILRHPIYTPSRDSGT